jgi:hypothetical protein
MLCETVQQVTGKEMQKIILARRKTKYNRLLKKDRESKRIVGHQLL